MQFRKKGKMRPMSQLWKEWGGKVFQEPALENVHWKSGVNGFSQ
jgi:hypothetical protein